MQLRGYVAALQHVVSAAPFIASTSFSYEERAPSAALIKGSLVFTDGSQLDFKEFLITHPELRVVKYGYHYRSGTRLIFRYDNANDPAATNLPSFPHHKHDPSGLSASEQPSLGKVLQEITSQLQSP